MHTPRSSVLCGQDAASTYSPLVTPSKCPFWVCLRANKSEGHDSPFAGDAKQMSMLGGSED